MVVPFLDNVAGTAVYINPHYVVTVRPGPGDLDRVSIVNLSDGEATRVRGERREVAEEPARTP